MKRKLAAALFSPVVILAITFAMLLLPRAPQLEKPGFWVDLPFGATAALADSTDPTQGGPSPATEPDLPQP